MVLLPLVRAFAEAEANKLTTGSDAPGFAALLSSGGSVLILLDLVALGLGVVGVAQRRGSRVFAVLGILVSILVLALIYELGIAWEPPLHDRPPGFPSTSR